MKMWSDLILDFTKSRNLYSISLGELYASELCQNNKINRRLSMESLRQIIDWMVKNNFADYAAGKEKDKVFVYWRSIQEIAGAIHKWADATNRIGSVETVIDLTDDPANKKEIFYKLPIETVLKACTALQQ